MNESCGFNNESCNYLSEILDSVFASLFYKLLRSNRKSAIRKCLKEVSKFDDNTWKELYDEIKEKYGSIDSVVEKSLKYINTKNSISTIPRNEMTRLYFKNSIKKYASDLLKKGDTSYGRAADDVVTRYRDSVKITRMVLHVLSDKYLVSSSGGVGDEEGAGAGRAEEEEEEEEEDEEEEDEDEDGGGEGGEDEDEDEDEEDGGEGGEGGEEEADGEGKGEERKREGEDGEQMVVNLDRKEVTIPFPDD